MIKKNLFKIVLSVCIVLVLLFISLFTFHTFKKSRIVEKELNYRIIEKSIYKYQQVWNDAPKEFACGYLENLENVDSNYFKNNPDYFECFLSKGRVLVEIDHHKYYVMALPQKSSLHYKVVTRSTSNDDTTPLYAIEVELKVVGSTEDSIKILFEDSFHEVFLPQRKYGIGPFKVQGDLMWDNFGQNIFIDKYLVTYRDIAEWKFNSDDEEVKKITIDLPADKKELVKPASSLDLDLMKKFCHFRGKELLQSHIYDSATFHPVELDDPKPLKVVRGPYPWTFRRKNILEDMDPFDFKLCAKLFVADCRSNAAYEFYDTRSSAWIGIYQILGGYMEAVNNIFEPNKNLVPSSFYFDYLSPWHELGVRASWDGKESVLGSFDWDLDGKQFPPVSDVSKLKVSFRCMRYVSEK